MTARAQVTFTNDEAQFLIDNPRLLTQRFDSSFVAPGSVAGCDTPLDSNNTAGCFPDGAILPGVIFDDSNHEFLDLFGVNFNATSGNTSKALGLDNHSETLDVVFTKGGVSAAGIRPGCFVLIPGLCHKTLTVRAFDAGNALIGSKEVDVSSLFDDFLGLESTATIARISIEAEDLGPDTGFAAIEEVSFQQQSEIPTLSEWGMVAATAGLVLIGMLNIIRRRDVS